MGYLMGYPMGYPMGNPMGNFGIPHGPLWDSWDAMKISINRVPVSRYRLIFSEDEAIPSRIFSGKNYTGVNPKHKRKGSLSGPSLSGSGSKPLGSKPGKPKLGSQSL